MWPFQKKPRQRRTEPRPGSASALRQGLRRFRDAGGLPALLTLVLLCAVVVVLDVWPVEPFTYRVGQYVERDLHARTDFRVLQEGALRDEIVRVRERTPAVFRLRRQRVEEIVSGLRGIPAQLAAAERLADVPADLRQRLGLEDEDALTAWKQRAADSQAAEGFAAAVEALRDRLAAFLLVAPEAMEQQRRRNADTVELLDAPSDSARLTALVPREGQDGRWTQEVQRLAKPFAAPVQAHVAAWLQRELAEGEPLYVYEAQRTEQRIAENVRGLQASPPPNLYRTYQRGEVLVERSRRLGAGARWVVAGLDESGLQLLRREHEAFWDTPRARRRAWGIVLGRSALVLFVLVTLSAYLLRYQRDLVTEPGRALRLAGLLVVLLALSKALHQGLRLDPAAAVLPVVMGAAVLSIAYDQRLALALGGILAVLTALQLRADMPGGLLLVAAVLATVAQLREVRTRSKLVRVACITAGVLLVVVLAEAAATGMPWRFAFFRALWAGGAAVLAGFLVQGVLPLVEYVFRIATSMTLLEWCDASKPLLKRLAMKAPGTYNHSLQLGSMCEAAAEAIGARGLLARVGAYYHDIGKTNKPAYFIENESDSASKHAKLSPAMSLLIIIAHVKDGLEMAREYGLPRQLWEFIATHHGTTLVQYFYHAAAEQRKSDADRAPDEVEFRYPGPKPHSREAAILMLADAAESSVRAMDEPTPGRIENQVHTVVNRRLMDGQLDECGLTLKEVHEVESSLIKSLCSIYHGRIAYPTPAGQKPSAAERAAARAAEQKPAQGEQTPASGEQPAQDGRDRSAPAAPGEARQGEGRPSESPRQVEATDS